MERAWHSREGHGAHEYRHILVKTKGRHGKKKVFFIFIKEEISCKKNKKKPKTKQQLSIKNST